MRIAELSATADLPARPAAEHARVPTDMTWARRLGEAAAFLLLYFAYDTARDAVAGAPGRAFANADLVVRLERAVGLFHERAVQRAVVDHTWLVRLCDGYYGWIHFAVPIAVCGVLLWRGDPFRWARWRTTFLLLCGLALLGFWLFPLAPPRLLAGSGFVDTMVSVGGPGISPHSAADVGNAFAAMPSLHAGWSLWAACAFVPLARRRLTRTLAVLHPVIITGVIVVTANHYVVDALAGWLCLGVAYALARILERCRPALVAFRPAGGERTARSEPVAPTA